MNKLAIKGIHTFIITDSNGKVKRKFSKSNHIVLAGRTYIGQILGGLIEGGVTSGVNYCALGTGSASITDNDIQLENEGARKVRGSSQSSGDSFIVSFYFNPSEANGTWTRYGTFIDGNSAENSGTLLSHIAINLTKLSGEGLTINSQYTISYSGET